MRNYWLNHCQSPRLTIYYGTARDRGKEFTPASLLNNGENGAKLTNLILISVLHVIVIGFHCGCHFGPINTRKPIRRGGAPGTRCTRRQNWQNKREKKMSHSNLFTFFCCKNETISFHVIKSRYQFSWITYFLFLFHEKGKSPWKKIKNADLSV